MTLRVENYYSAAAASASMTRRSRARRSRFTYATCFSFQMFTLVYYILLYFGCIYKYVQYNIFRRITLSRRVVNLLYIYIYVRFLLVFFFVFRFVPSHDCNPRAYRYDPRKSLEYFAGVDVFLFFPLTCNIVVNAQFCSVFVIPPLMVSKGFSRFFGK